MPSWWRSHFTSFLAANINSDLMRANLFCLDTGTWILRSFIMEELWLKMIELLPFCKNHASLCGAHAQETPFSQSILRMWESVCMKKWKTLYMQSKKHCISVTIASQLKPCKVNFCNGLPGLAMLTNRRKNVVENNADTNCYNAHASRLMLICEWNCQGVCQKKFIKIHLLPWPQKCRFQSHGRGWSHFRQHVPIWEICDTNSSLTLSHP